MSSGPERDDVVDPKRRNFLKITVIASAALAAGSAGFFVAEGAGTSHSKSIAFPKIKVADIVSGQLANVNRLQVNDPVSFFYPLDSEPNILVKLGLQAEGGIGPDGDIVAFSVICQHLGCDLNFVATGASPPCDSSFSARQPILYCCCHYSIYDVLNGAALEPNSMARFPVPRVILEVDSGSGDIYATGMTPPVIFGHADQPGSMDIAQDLSGGTLVQDD